jgi:polar amino acid transport system permease protein
MSFSEQLELVWKFRTSIFQSLGISMLIALLAVVLGFVIGVVIAGIKIAPKNNILFKILDKFADLYVTVIRGTPMLVQLILMYGVVLASFKYGSNNLLVPILSFGINSGAYMAEIIRSGVNSVDKGQMEAGRSLGLSWFSTMRFIVIPQAIKVVVPTIFNEIIILVKETSVVSAIVLKVGGAQVYDLFGIIAKIQRTSPACYTATIIIIALIYLVIVLLLTLVQKMIEKRLSANDR